MAELRKEEEVDASQGLDRVSSRTHPGGPTEGYSWECQEAWGRVRAGLELKVPILP